MMPRLMTKAAKTKTFPATARAAFCLTMLLVLALTDPAARSADAKFDNKLLGTWKLVSAKYGGEEANFGQGVTSLKHVTTSQFMWVSYDKDGKVTRTAGGDYTLTGDVYEETPRYGIGGSFDMIKGKPQTFKWKIEGNKWYHNGKLSNGLTIDEVWERVEQK